MENKNLDQYQNNANNEVKIGLTRDGRSITVRVPGVDKFFFKAVAYVEKVIESAKKRQASMTSVAEKVKG